MSESALLNGLNKRIQSQTVDSGIGCKERQRKPFTCYSTYYCVVQFFLKINISMYYLCNNYNRI